MSCILRISSYSNFYPALTGGKACSLSKLMNYGFSVPAAWVIPCQYTFSRPSADKLRSDILDIGIPGTWTYAVRSGAPVSMPGLMETKLNVPYEQLPEAVNAVWDSYFTENAVEYRKLNNLDEKMGTGVIIQQMVNAKFSGVAFTEDPTAVFGKTGKFNPLVEYVEGLGESLVGGKVTPTKLTKFSFPWCEELWTTLYQIHSYLGASDVEWCVEKASKSIYLLQQRPVKFPEKPPIQTLSKGTVVVPGLLSIGAPGQVTAKVVTTPAEAPGNLIFSKEFTPELYMAMVKSVGILTTEGGQTCHAGIIARDMGKPALGGVTEAHIAALKGLVVTLDGVDGCIRKASEEDAEKNVRGPARRRFPERRPTFDWIPKSSDYWGEDKSEGLTRFDALELLTRVYGNVDRHHKGEITRERLDEIVGEVAKVFRTYLYQITVGEARHCLRGCVYIPDSPKQRLGINVWSPNSPGYQLYQNKVREYALTPLGKEYFRTRRLLHGAAGRLKALGITIPKNLVDRADFTGELREPETLDQAIAVTKLCSTIFHKFPWSDGYGGKKWGDICDVLLQHLIGELTDMLFVDAVFNLVHNGGTIFGKLHWMKVRSKATMGYMLDYKRKGDIEGVFGLLNSLLYMYKPASDCCVLAPTIFMNCNLTRYELEEAKSATA